MEQLVDNIDGKEAVAARDKILGGDRFGESEGFERPKHADFMDSTELRGAKWSGIRSNTIVGRVEVWVLGEMLRDFAPSDTNGQATFMEEAFGLSPSQVEIV